MKYTDQTDPDKLRWLIRELERRHGDEIGLTLRELEERPEFTPRPERTR